ncbi:MAG: putative transcriptional regulator [Dinoroseobacter sp.]
MIMMTQTIKHHLTDNIVTAYAAGSLPEAFNLLVATHVSMCDECRATVAAHEAVGGVVLEDVREIDLGVDALEACFAMIETGPKDPIKLRAQPTKPNSESRLFPTPLHDYVGGDLDAVKWRKVGGGVKQAILPTSKDASVRLLYIPAGCEVPDHGHNGTEMTLVLQGAFRDEFARFGTGDVEICDAQLEHKPIAEEGEDCICLAATDAPLKFSGFLPKLAQPFLRI